MNKRLRKKLNKNGRLVINMNKNTEGANNMDKKIKKEFDILKGLFVHVGTDKIDFNRLNEPTGVLWASTLGGTSSWYDWLHNKATGTAQKIIDKAVTFRIRDNSNIRIVTPSNLCNEATTNNIRKWKAEGIDAIWADVEKYPSIKYTNLVISADPETYFAMSAKEREELHDNSTEDWGVTTLLVLNSSIIDLDILPEERFIPEPDIRSYVVHWSQRNKKGIFESHVARFFTMKDAEYYCDRDLRRYIRNYDVERPVCSEIFRVMPDEDINEVIYKNCLKNSANMRLSKESFIYHANKYGIRIDKDMLNKVFEG